MFWFFTAMALIYSLAYTVYVVPYTALGYELTSDYDERTRVLAWRMYIGLIASMTIPWLYKLCLHPVFGGNVVRGAPWVCVGVGLLIVGTGLLPAVVGREHPAAQVQDKIHLRKAIFCTLKNKPFLMLLFTYLVIICGIFTSQSLGLYLNIYFVCNGSKDFAATLSGYTGTLQAVTSYVSLPLIAYISTRWGKRHAMITGLCFGAVGTASLWLTLTPRAPYLQLISMFTAALGMQGCWLMVSSMVADICDEDELETGLRREGVYSAVIGFALKLGLAITALTGGVVLKLSGYDATLAEKAGHVAEGVLFNMKVLYIGVQCAALLVAAALFLFYPISRARAEQTRRILDERARAKSAVSHGSGFDS
ncbi:MAG: MFS transporter, partial [Verrucomicrobiota bacterium]